MENFLKRVAKEIVENEVDSDMEYNIAMFIETYNLLLTEEQEAFLIKEINKLISKQGGLKWVILNM